MNICWMDGWMNEKLKGTTSTTTLFKYMLIFDEVFDAFHLYFDMSSL